MEGLRPTPDRVRETLFNWLNPLIVGARCLDLFSGSGALAVEALSRGAAHVTAVDPSEACIANLEGHLRRLEGLDRATLVRDRAEAFLAKPPPGQGYDVVFIDPPYDAGLYEPVLAKLADGWLSPVARLYLEWRGPLETLLSPDGPWRLVREKRAGQVVFGLATPVSVASGHRS